MIKACPNVKKKNGKTRLKAMKGGKSATVATWSGNDSSKTESEDEEKANLYLMAKENI